VIAPRWRKVLADIAEHPLRAALAVLAMAAGVFGVGFILSSYAVLGRELGRTFEETRPASAVLLLDRLGPGLADSVRAMPGVADAEARPYLRGQLRVSDHTVPLMLFVVPDFGDVRLDRFVHEAGAWPPADDAFLVERSALSVTGARLGDRVTAKMAGGSESDVVIAGSVHAAGLPPGWMDHVVTGFVGSRSILRADPAAEVPAVRFLVAERPRDRAHIQDVASEVRARVEAAGYHVRRVDVPEPGRHPHAAQMDTFLFLLGAFGALALVLSAIVVASLIHALVAEQVRQIGVMKSLGARDGQISALYLGQVAILAVAALAIGIPAGVAGGRAYVAFATNMLNANVVSNAVPLWVFLVQVLVGLGVPLLVALVPVRRASRVTVREALADRGTSGAAFGTRRLERALLAVPGLPRPLALWLRSTLQRRARLTLTVATLAMGGAVFVAAINVSAAWQGALARDGATKQYDLDVQFPRPTSTALLQGVIGSLPAVAHMETYSSGSADLVGSLGGESQRVALLGAAPGSPMLAPRLIAGRWLRAGDDSAVVVNQAALRAVPGLALGDSLRATIRGRTLAWPIVGVVKELHPGPAAYALPAAVRAATGDADSLARGARIMLAGHDDASQRAGQASLQSALEGSGIEGAGITRLLDLRKAFADHLIIIYTALYLAAALVVLVGGIGLTSTLLLNVFERTREIGVLRAIGAAPRVIAQNVVIEGVVIGVLSWFLALVATIPATLLLDALTGKMFVNAPVDFVFSAQAAGAWLLLVVVLAALGSLYPAWRAARLTVREVLAHE
jgi:putative ABC transport system permease protein